MKVKETIKGKMQSASGVSRQSVKQNKETCRELQKEKEEKEHVGKV